MSNIDLTQYGIKGTPKIYHNTGPATTPRGTNFTSTKPTPNSPATKKARTPSLARLT